MNLILLAILQSLLLCFGQVFLKFALQNMGTPELKFSFIVSQLTNWWWLGCGVFYTAAAFLWFYIVKKFPFSMAYPLVSLSYVFGMIAAIVFFKEDVPAIRWVGVLLIMAGCYFIAK